MTVPGPALGESRAGVWRLGFEILLVSLALMLFEINLVRLFSILIRNVSFLVLAMALFGFGLGGLYAQIGLRRGGDLPRDASFRFVLPLLTAASMVFALFMLSITPIGRPGQELWLPLWVAIGVLFLCTSLPFLFGSMYMAHLFAMRAQEAPRLYFSDLLGAAGACVLSIPLFQFFGGFAMPFLTAILMLIPAVAASIGRPRIIAPLAAMLLLGWMGYANLQAGLLRITPEGDKHERTLHLSAWNFFSWISVQEDFQFRGWRLSENYAGPEPEYLVIRQDGHAPAWITKFDGDERAVEHLKWDITALPFRILGQPEDVLVIGVGGGRDILTAKLYGVPRIKGVELNPITVNRVMRGAFREYSGNVYGMDGVSVVVENGRTYVERTGDTYDLIYTSLADTLLGNSEGVFVLSENHLYTVEAFAAYLDRLKPGGVAAILYSALNEGHLLPRFLNTGMEALRMHGITNPAAHILAVMTPDPPREADEGVCIMFSKEPVTEEMVARANASCEELGFFLAWPPGGAPNPWTEQVAQMLDPEARAAYMAETYFDLRPLHDDRPYLFYVTKPQNFFSMMLRPAEAAEKVPAGLLRLPFLIDTFFAVLVLVLVLMISPLVVFRRSELEGARPEQAVFLGLFLLLGVAFMLIEVAFLQRLFLYLGNPTLTFAVTLGAMLLFTGLGSLLSRRFPEHRLWNGLLAAAVVAVLLQSGVYALLPAVLDGTMGLALPVRLAVSFAFLAVLALPMGMLFPTCLRLLAWRRLDMICWAWGMNGVGSVLGSVGASLLAINLGIRNVFLVGIVCYAAFFLLGLAGRRVAGTARPAGGTAP